jgi:hypothetical protein
MLALGLEDGALGEGKLAIVVSRAIFVAMLKFEAR